MTRMRIGAGALDGSGPVLVVSPHLDDGVMSCGCLIAGLARDRSVTVATIFAGRPEAHAEPSEWDRAAGFRPGDDVVGARRDEDRRALAVLRARPHWLAFRDSQYGPSPRRGAIARRLAGLTLLRTADTIVFPLGLFHSDHRLARDAVLTLLRRHARQALRVAYEDVPYRRLPGLRDAAVARLRRAGFALRAARIAADAGAVRRKARAIACYRSQLRALATPGRLGHADAYAEERYWLLDERRRACPHSQMRHCERP